MEAWGDGKVVCPDTTLIPVPERATYFVESKLLCVDEGDEELLEGSDEWSIHSSARSSVCHAGAREVISAIVIVACLLAIRMRL